MADRWRRRAAGVAVLTVMLTLAAVGPARAQTAVTGAQLQALAERASGDPRALAQLRVVQQVDGRPVDMARALAGAEGPELMSRLQALAGGGAPAPATVDALQARQAAEDVLEGRRFKPSRVPRPFAGILRTLGGWLEPVVEPLGGLWARITASVAGQLALVAVVFALALLICARLVGRRSPDAIRRSTRLGAEGEGLDPDELERRAAEAERAGDLDRAVRLRFVAGVLRLDEAGVVTYSSSLTTGQLRARLGAGTFAELAAAFDEIAYGGRPAAEGDVRAAAEGWPRVLAEARR
jgi:hypothetical protein